MAFSLKQHLKTALEATRLTADALEGVRQDIRGLRAKMREVEYAPDDQETAIHRLAHWIATQSRLMIAPDISAFSAPISSGNVAHGNISGAIAVYLAPRLEEVMKEELAKFYKNKTSYTSAERTLKLAELDRQTLDLELVEESIIREAEQSGLSFPRRGDADPRAVLADKSVLP